MSNVTEELLKESDAFLKGHFLLSSGKHSDGYVQCAKLLMYSEKAERVLSGNKKRNRRKYSGFGCRTRYGWNNCKL